MDTLGQRLQYWRESEKLSVYELARITTIQPEELYLVETGQSLPTSEMLNKLKIYTQLDFNWFLLGAHESISNHHMVN